MAVYIRRRCEGHRLMSEPAIYELLDHGVRYQEELYNEGFGLSFDIN